MKQMDVEILQQFYKWTTEKSLFSLEEVKYF